MATRSEIRHNIENTRDNITLTVDRISDTIHSKVDIGERIKANPYNYLAIAAIAGFALATFSTPIGKSLMRIALKSATAAAGAYVSKKGMNLVASRIMPK
jgi:hypothetical protein